MIAFDSEDDQRGNPSLVCFFNGTEFADLHGPGLRDRAAGFMRAFPGEEFWAHNLEYDLLNILPLRQSPLRHHFNGSRLVFAAWDGRSFYDTANLSNPPLSIRAMGEQVGLPKLTSPPFDGRVTPELITYCRRDAEIAFRWVECLRAKLEAIGGRLLPTLPAIALDLFRTRFYTGDLDHDRRATPFLRRGYAGGRTEVFRVGPVLAPGQIHNADVQSMYPSVMLAGSYPVPLSSYRAERLDLEAEGVAEVALRLPPMPIPPLRFARHGKLVFPVGKMRGVWTMPEIRAAVAAGGEILAFHQGVYFSEMERPFRNYVDFFWAMKQRGGEDRDLAKYLLNSLYGKFGETGQGESFGPEGRSPALRACRHANVIWAAYVTAYARLRLWQMLTETMDRDGEVLYCDTDSVIYRAPTPIWNGGGLGELQHKGTYSLFEAKLPKLYRLDDEFHAKGVPHNKAEDFFTAGCARFLKPNRMRESLKRGLVPNEWCEQAKHLRSRYDKRLVHADGTTSPLVLG